MSEWTDGYRAALADVERLACTRNHGLPWLSALLDDLRQDSLVIEHEQGNRLQKRRLAAAREALPLFAEKDEAP
jgi:hypothetical protein